MILLDTNVVSEPLRPAPSRHMLDWFDGQALETLYLSAFTVAELRSGVTLMPMGKKRDALHERLEQQILPVFAGRILPFDASCTQSYAALIAKTRAAGFSISTADACIAATALANGFTVASRDVSPFQAAGLNVINPWLTDR